MNYYNIFAIPAFFYGSYIGARGLYRMEREETLMKGLNDFLFVVTLFFIWVLLEVHPEWLTLIR